MVARAYHNLGAIGGEAENRLVPYSKRGKDQDRFQTFIFDCDELDPFTGIVHLQGSVNEPPVRQSRATPSATLAGEDLLWSDIVELDFDTEGGEIFVQIEIEMAQVRVVVKTGNYTAGRIKQIRTMR